MAQLGETTPTDFVVPHQKEAVKQFLVYDGQGRLIENYVALTEAQDGARCLLTEYAYEGASNRVEKTKESLALWDATWDI